MKDRARSLRQDMTDAENRMWYFLRNRRLNGYKFVREVDGCQHMDAIEYDQRRTAYLIKLGYNVLRVWNNEVFNNIEGVLETILSSLENRAT